jgi:hypothetical protein
MPPASFFDFLYQNNRVMVGILLVEVIAYQPKIALKWAVDRQGPKKPLNL